MIKTNVFDIETAPRFDLIPQNVKPFKRSSVKLGLMVDPVKIVKKIENAEAKYWQDAKDDAQLNPFTSEICAIGVHLDDYGYLHCRAFSCRRRASLYFRGEYRKIDFFRDHVGRFFM